MWWFIIFVSIDNDIESSFFFLFSCARTDNNTRITLRNKSQCRSHKLLGTATTWKKSSFVSFRSNVSYQSASVNNTISRRNFKTLVAMSTRYEEYFIVCIHCLLLLSILTSLIESLHFWRAKGRGVREDRVQENRNIKKEKRKIVIKKIKFFNVHAIEVKKES